MQARDPKSDRYRPTTGPSGPAIRNGVVPIGSVRMPPTLPSGRVTLRPSPRLPVITHGETPGAGQRYPSMPAARSGFGLPNLRRNVCPHFYMTGSRGAIPIQAPHLLKALIRQEQNVSRCQLRGGVHLEQGYVNDVCLTPRFNQCVFYEDELTKD
jgi:hypothetical protein